MSGIVLTEAERTVIAEIIDRCINAHTDSELRHHWDDWTEVDFAALDSLRDKVGA